MTYQEKEQIRLKRWHSQQAIALAMQGRWREAVAANQKIIASFPNDVDAYNRLGKACMELGEYSQAEEAYRQTISLDPYNAIAKKNLFRLSRLGLGEVVASLESESHKVEPQHFIEEVGKAGVVNLYRLAPPEVLARMAAGDRAYLKIDGTSLVVQNERGDYLGQVKPRHGQRLVRLIEGGNKYSAAIVSATEDKTVLIIREIYQDPSQVGQPSFPSKRFEGPRPYAGDRLVRRQLEYEEELVGEPGYTIIEAEAGAAPEEPPVADGEVNKDEEQGV